MPEEQTPMTDAQHKAIMERFDAIQEKFETGLHDLAEKTSSRFDIIEGQMVRKGDLLSAILQIFGFTLAVIVAVIVVANAFGAFG